MSGPATIEAFFDAATGTISYVVSDQVTRSAAIVDPVLGHLPPADNNGIAYLRIPLNAFPVHCGPAGDGSAKWKA
jgi:hypothetical protein